MMKTSGSRIDLHFPDFSEAQRYQNMLSLERCVLEKLPEPMPKIVFHPKSTQTLPRTVTFPIETAFRTDF